MATIEKDHQACRTVVSEFYFMYNVFKIILLIHLSFEMLKYNQQSFFLNCEHSVRLLVFFHNFKEKP